MATALERVFQGSYVSGAQVLILKAVVHPQM